MNISTREYVFLEHYDGLEDDYNKFIEGLKKNSFQKWFREELEKAISTEETMPPEWFCLS